MRRLLSDPRGRPRYWKSLIAGQVVVALVVGQVSASSAAAGQTPRPPPKLAPFVVSPPEVVERMLKLAGVTSADVVYDLGCGDGRIVIAAARMFGSRGVGVDIDASLIAQARQQAEEAGVSHLVEFRVADALETDLAPATVVALYLLPSGNALVRPKLQRELRRGARVVAHSFDMGPTWRPTRSETFYDLAGLPRIIHLWRVRGRR